MKRTARPLAVLSLIVAVAVHGGDAAAGYRGDPNKNERGKIKEEYSTTAFAVRPMIVPIMDDGGMRQQYLVRFDIILNDADDRDFMFQMLPRIRNEAYQVLLNVVTFRTLKPRIPPKPELEAHLLRAIGGAVGRRKVKRIRVMLAQPGELPSNVR